MADSTVVALIFEDEQAAERLFDTLEETLKAETFPVDNAAVAIYKQNGEVIVKQWSHPNTREWISSSALGVLD